jgi:hypothetical protein
MATPTRKKKRRVIDWEKIAADADIPILPVRRGATTKEIYAAAHRAFTAADLQKYTVIEEGIPMRMVLAEMEAIDREYAKNRRRTSKNGRPR